MKEELRELYKYRELLYTIVWRDIKVRYKQSVMGFLWAVLMPIVIVMSGIVVRYAYGIASHSPLQSTDIASVAVKSLPWAFLVSSIRFAGLSLTNNRDLVTKVYFPKTILPLAAVMASLFDFFIASGALVIFLLFVQKTWSIQIAWVPLLLLAMVLLASGIGMVVSAASLFFRDVKYIVEILLTFGIFFTPVFYEVGMLGDKGRWLLLNPIAPILEGLAGSVVREQPPQLFWLAYAFGLSLAVFLGGYAFFRHLEPAFAESI
jgi:lipopolysaccharide transport system permease protein